MRRFLNMLLGTLDARLLVNLLTGKGINREGEGKIINCKIFNSASPSNKSRDTKVLDK